MSDDDYVVRAVSATGEVRWTPRHAKAGRLLYEVGVLLRVRKFASDYELHWGDWDDARRVRIKSRRRAIRVAKRKMHHEASHQWKDTPDA